MALLDAHVSSCLQNLPGMRNCVSFESFCLQVSETTLSGPANAKLNVMMQTYINLHHFEHSQFYNLQKNMHATQ